MQVFIFIYFNGDIMNNGIQVIYPRTKYNLLNEEIFLLIQRHISNFMKFAKAAIQENIIYTLDISHDEYSYQKYLSFVFYISSYTGGAHPEHIVACIVYDVKENKIIHLSDLIQEKPNILEILSKESRKILAANANIQNLSMMMEGTKSTISNFSHFVFAPTGIMIFFPEYQVAPYSSGAFKVVIPYSSIFNIEKGSN